jgi:hypothetical protein
MQSIFKLYDRLKYINLDLKFSSADTLPKILRDLSVSSVTRSEAYMKLMQLSNLLGNNVISYSI